jgi:hypothetical protein
MAVIDKAAAFLSQLNPAMQTVGADIARQGAGVLQRGADKFATTGVAVSLLDQAMKAKQNPLIGKAASGLASASNFLHSGGQSLDNMSPGQQTALGYGAAATGALATGTAAAGIMRARKDKKERLAGQNLGAQLGVQMPGVI